MPHPVCVCVCVCVCLFQYQLWSCQYGDWLSRLLVVSVLNKLLLKHSGDVVYLDHCLKYSTLCWITSRNCTPGRATGRATSLTFHVRHSVRVLFLHSHLTFLTPLSCVQAPCISVLCSAQSRNLRNLEIALRIFRIAKLRANLEIAHWV